MSEVEETLKRINSHKGVQGIVIINSDGVPIRSTLEQSLSTNYAAHIMSLASKARSAVRTLDPQNDLTFLRIRSKKHEILVAPEKVRAVPSTAAAHRGSALPVGVTTPAALAPLPPIAMPPLTRPSIHPLLLSLAIRTSRCASSRTRTPSSEQ